MLENVNTFNDPSKLTESFVCVCRCLYANKKFYLACFQYVGQNSLFECLYDIYYELWKININTMYMNAKVKLTENEINLMARLKAHSLVGIIQDWVNDGMRGNYMQFFEEIRNILDSEISEYAGISNKRLLEKDVEELTSTKRKKEKIC